MYIPNPHVDLFLRKAEISYTSFIGTVGGLLGLFLGFSCISIVEVFYIFAFGMEKATKILRQVGSKRPGRGK